MTGSLVSAGIPTPRSARAVCLAGALLGGAVVVASSAAGWAQQGPPAVDKPLRLMPLPQPSEGRSPRPPEPETPGPEVPTEAPAPGPQLQGPRIETNALETIDPDSTGTLTANEGGLGEAMWAETSRALVDALLPHLPVNATSSAMRDLMRRLLTSRAAAPKGEAGKGSLIGLRVRLLAAMGDLSGVDTLLGAIPGRGENDELARIEADVSFLTNDNSRACSLARSRIESQDDAYWRKAFIFCQALAREHDKAALGAALLREMGEDDAAFFALIEALAGDGEASLPTLPEPTPLHLALARVAKARLPADVVASNRPGVLRTIAMSPNAPVEVRLEAAERAEAAGALDIDALRQLYTSVSFTQEELANPLSRAEAEAGPMSRALLYRTALIQTVPMAQTEAIVRALELGREGGRYASTARVFLPLLKRIPPSREMIWFAPQAIRAFLVIGEHDAAQAWFGLLRGSAMFNVTSAAALRALAPLARLAGSREVADLRADSLRAWWKDVENRDDARERASLLYTLFEGLGEPVPAALWEALLGGAQRATVAMPEPALWYRLASAARAGRVGETVLLTLLVLGEGGPGQANPVVLRRVLTSLADVGLTGPARAMAVEAAVAAGL